MTSVIFRKNLIVATLLCICCSCCLAQDTGSKEKTSDTKTDGYFYRTIHSDSMKRPLAIRIGMLSLLHNSYNLFVEYRFRDKIGLQLEGQHF